MGANFGLTTLVTAYDQPALGGVYKLSMVGPKDGALSPRVKLSEQAGKISNPGIQQVRRFSRAGKLVADAIFDEVQGCHSPTSIVDPVDPTRRRKLATDLAHEDLLAPVVRAGKVVTARPTLREIQARVRTQLDSLDPSVRRLVNAHGYPVGLTRELFAERTQLIEQLRVHNER